MGILENWKEIRKYNPWRSSLAHHGWRWVIGWFPFLIVFPAVIFLGSAIVGRETATTGALIAVILVAGTAAVIATYGLWALEDRLLPATRERVGLVAFWVAAVAAVGVCLALASM